MKKAGINKKSKILIFDFDGTIVDTKSVYYNAMNKHLNALGFSRKEVDKAIGMGLSVSETLRHLGFGRIMVWWMHRKIIKDVLKHACEIKKCKDVDAIRRIKERKILISNSLLEFVMPVLRHLKLEKEFVGIYGAEEFTDKAEFIRNYLRKNNVKPGDCFYIGDRVADVLLAREIGIKSIIISGKCSWDSRKEVLKQKPNYLLFDMADIKNFT